MLVIALSSHFAQGNIRVGDELPHFELINQNNQTVTDKDCLGKKTVLNFIFTRCCAATQCPAATHKMAQLQAKLIKDKKKDAQIFTITFDPQYDTPERLKHYAHAYEIEDENYHFLTGDESTIKRLMKRFGILTVGAENTIQHTMRTVVINTDGKITFSKQGIKWTVQDLLDAIEE